MTDLSPIKSQLQSFYDHEAKKYYETRKKFWKEGELLLQIIENHPLPEKVRILELGCGSGRFATYLREHYKGKFDYVGVDLSKQLLKYAQHDNPKCTFILGDISDFLAKTGQESFDLVI
jgi:predicted TPR repeat methyltransferase